MTSANYNWIHYAFDITKSLIHLPTKQKHEYIKLIKTKSKSIPTSYFKFTDKVICSCINTTTSSHIMYKRYASASAKKKELKVGFILFAYEVTNRELGLVKFSEFLNNFIANYKEDATTICHQSKPTTNKNLNYIKQLGDFIANNPTVLDYHFSVYYVQKTLCAHGKFCANDFRVKV